MREGVCEGGEVVRRCDRSVPLLLSFPSAVRLASLTRDFSLDGITAKVILTGFDFLNARWVCLWLSSAEVLRLCIPLGLHESQESVVVPGTKPGLLMGTEDAVEREARRRTFWAAFMCVSCAASLRQSEHLDVFRPTDTASPAPLNRSRRIDSRASRVAGRRVWRRPTSLWSCQRRMLSSTEEYVPPSPPAHHVLETKPCLPSDAALETDAHEGEHSTSAISQPFQLTLPRHDRVRLSSACLFLLHQC